MKKQVPIGSISWGTHRPDDLWEAFRPYLPDNEKWVREGDEWHEKVINAYHLPWEEYMETEEQLNNYVHSAFDYLESIAPEGYYFGAHPGDGSDFGFWPIDDEQII